MNDIQQRLERLRDEMRREHLGAFIFPSADPHQSEYVADHWKGREWISGFNGSAGTAVVTLTSAALWTDSRYFLAAEEQLKGTEFQLMRLKMEGTPSIAEWIGEELKVEGGRLEVESGRLKVEGGRLKVESGRLKVEGGRLKVESGKLKVESTEVGIDGWCASANTVKDLIAELRKNGGMTLRTNLDLLSRIWTDRPPVPENPVEIYPLKYAGESCRDKISRIRQALRERHADGMLMSALDDIAWTLNLRGSDVHCNPVFVSYLLISTTAVTLYINKEKLTPEVEAYLKAEGVGVDSYGNIKKGLDDYFEYNILMDPDEVNWALFGRGARNVVEEESPVKRMKTVKNAAEIAGFRSAMLRDGIAMVKFLKWLDETDKETQTEMSVSRKLAAFRAEQPLFRDISFDTIAGYQEHGAIVHYEATAETDAPLRPEGLLLLDSGAQYLDGTTDITRTIALGPLTEEQRRVYTLVLKGHIQLELAKFPAGTTGTQIDALARQPLWREGLNYLHGTGHGVGCYLNVHEGPHQIRMEWRPAPLESGMTVTDEPGIYLAGRFGVRIENTLLVVPYCNTESGQFLGFESLTLCPIDLSPVMVELLTSEERDWLNEYHRKVYEMLSPYLEEAEKQWLMRAI